jgi:hypothetical protein
MPSSHFSKSKNIAAEATENIRHSTDAHHWTTAVFKFLHSPTTHCLKEHAMTSVCYFWIYLFGYHANAPCYFFLQLRCQISPHSPILKGKVSSNFFFGRRKKCAHHWTPPDSKSFSIFSLPVSSQKTFEPVQDNKQSVYIRWSMLHITFNMLRSLVSTKCAEKF